MKKLLLITFLPVIAQAGYVSGYTKSNGTYVAPHYSAPRNSVRYDNPSSKSMGGSQRDEYSSPRATNKTNYSWGSADNDNDGISNSFDVHPNKKD